MIYFNKFLQEWIANSSDQNPVKKWLNHWMNNPDDNNSTKQWLEQWIENENKYSKHRYKHNNSANVYL